MAGIVATNRLSDEELVEALRLANIPTLLLLLTQLTGDESWLDGRFQPSFVRGLDDNDSGGLADDVQQEVRSAVRTALRSWFDDGAVAIPVPSPEAVVAWLSAAAGEAVPDEYGPMVQSEIASVGRGLTQVPAIRAAELDAIIVGAGVSGIAAGVRLGAAGVSYTVLERNAEVGGVWTENRYPAAAVDTPSHLYSFSFAPGDWPRWYGAREHIHSYLCDVADRFDVTPHVQFETVVERASYDADDACWRVGVRRADGSSEVLTARLLVSAVGAFNTPAVPPIPGLDTFGGPIFHTARWPEDLDLAGRRVLVLGNGASAMQVVPAIAPEVAELTVFQIEPHWIAPFPRFKQPVPEPVRQLMMSVPLYGAWYRARLSWIFNDKLYSALRRDPDWPHPERSTNARSEALRKTFTRYLTAELEGRDDLIDQLIPTYPPLGKRLLLDNGWYRTMRRDNVRLVSDRVVEIGPSSVTTASGETIECDAIVLATGFDVVSFLSTLDVVGRGGQPLSTVWDGDDAAAYLGLAVPDFPNFFILYGPNTQTGHGGSLIGLVEAQLNHIVSLLEQVAEVGADTVEVRPEVFEAYNARVDAEHAQMVWTHPGMETYFRNSRGRVVVNSPYRVVDFWTMTSTADLADYTLTGPSVGSTVEPAEPTRVGSA
jgi:4-hydroxyacetophenone monooxygenase